MRAQKGFTLMELVITMVIIGVLTAIAIPSYVAYITRANRKEAKAQMLLGAIWMEKWRVERGRFDDPANANNPPPTYPATLLVSPVNGAAKYNIAVAATPLTFTITATPTGTMTGDPCGAFTVNNLGVRTPTAPTYCWGQ